MQSFSLYAHILSSGHGGAVPSSVHFKEIVIDAFKQNGKANIVRWVCGQAQLQPWRKCFTDLVLG